MGAGWRCGAQRGNKRGVGFAGVGGLLGHVTAWCVRKGSITLPWLPGGTSLLKAL